MRIYICANLLLIILVITGCSVPLRHAPKQPIQTNVNQLVYTLPLGRDLAGKISSHSKIALRSMELDETVDLPMIALIEDQMIQSLENQGFSVLERDQNALRHLVFEGENNSSHKVQTQLHSVDYILSYRLISFNLWHKPEKSMYSRQSKLEIHYRILDAKTGMIVHAGFCNGNKLDKVAYDKRNIDYHYTLFPHEIKPALDKAPLLKVVSETIPKNSKLALRFIETDETEDNALNASIEDQVVVALLKGGYTLYERDANSIRHYSQENSGKGLLFIQDDAHNRIGTVPVDYILSYRIGEVNIKHEALIGSLEIYRHGLLSLHLRFEKASTGEIVKATDLFGTSSYSLPNPVLGKLRDYRYIKFAPSANPVDPTGGLYYEKVSRPNLENRKWFILRPTINLARTNDQSIMGAGLDYGINFSRHHELYISSSLAGVATDYGFAYHGINYGLATRARNITFNPFIGVGRADATYVVFDWHGFPIGMETDKNPGLRYGVYLEYHLKANSIGIGYQGILTESKETRASMMSLGFRF